MKLKFLSLFALALVLCFSCSEDSNSDSFMDDNPNAISQLITSISVVSAQDPSENRTITINYDTANRVQSVTDGVETGIFAYQNGDLANVQSGLDVFSVDELYQAPYDAFETGEVLTYNTDGNPVLLSFFDTEFDWDTNMDVTVEYRAEIEYETQLNPYFYTIQAAGGIDVMDNVQFNFSANPNAPQLVQASALFPSKNIKKITYLDLDGNMLAELSMDYVYNANNYPTSATATSTEYDEFDGDTTSIFTLTYTYLQ